MSDDVKILLMLAIFMLVVLIISCAVGYVGGRVKNHRLIKEHCEHITDRHKYEHCTKNAVIRKIVVYGESYK